MRSTPSRKISFLPLALWRWTRPLVWTAMIVMHVGNIGLVSFADLSAGMLMVHLFTADRRWIGMARSVLRRSRDAYSLIELSASS